LIIIIQEHSHPVFKRKNNDLIQTINIQLVDALKCSPISIKTLDNRIVLVPIDQILNQKSVKQVKGEGMPIYGGDKKGDLYLKFNITFPVSISHEIKEELKQLLA